MGGVSIPPGLKAPGAGYSNGPNQVPYAPAGDKVNWAELIKGLPAALAGAQFVSQASREPYKAKTPTELRAMLPSNTPAAGGALANAWKVGANAPTVRADAQATSLVPSTRKYADGGEVQGPLSMVPPPGPSGPMQAFSGAVQGDDGGQSDLVDAQLSAGEYVIDAESVSMLGDGNTEAGIKKLDELRLSLRAHKRSVPDEQIAPPSEGPLSYIQGAA